MVKQKRKSSKVWTYIFFTLSKKIVRWPGIFIHFKLGLKIAFNDMQEKKRPKKRMISTASKMSSKLFLEDDPDLEIHKLI